MMAAFDHYRARRHRDATFGKLAVVFGEPAWDVLLDLQHAALRRRAISVSSACIAACVPASTALRHLSVLARHGLIERQADPLDRRRAYIALTELGEDLMAAATRLPSLDDSVQDFDEDRDRVLREIVRLATTHIAGRR